MTYSPGTSKPNPYLLAMPLLPEGEGADFIREYIEIPVQQLFSKFLLKYAHDL